MRGLLLRLHRGQLPRMLVCVMALIAVVAVPGPAGAQGVADCLGEAATIVGTPGADVISGTSGRDVIQGLSGDDVIRGRGGNDTLRGGDGQDRVSGGAGDDIVEGGDGDDILTGNMGNDEVLGGAGVDQLRGGPGDDFMDGGLGVDDLAGGGGADTLVDGPGTLAAMVDAGDREGIRAWTASRSIATINDAVDGLGSARLDLLPGVLLDSNATSDVRDRLERLMRDVLGQSGVGYYVEIRSYTFIDIVAGGFLGTCNHVFLDPSAFASLDDASARGVLMHESFHSFNCVNHGPPGALDEGSAIWVAKSTFPAGLDPAETRAEATYGTKLVYRDILGVPDFPLQAPDAGATQKLRDAYALLSARDPSQLPWNSQTRLVSCFEKYFESLDRNVDFFAVWLPAVQEATNQMLADPDCRPI